MGIYILIFVAFVLGIGLLIQQTIGLERIWATVAKDDFSDWTGFDNLNKTPKQNQYLVCPKGACQSPPDRLAPLYNIAAEQLMDEFHTIMLENGALLIKIDEATNTYIYRTHSPSLKFPDLTFALAQDVTSEDQSNQYSTLLLYAKAQLGELDFGANQKRIDAMLGILQTRLEQSALEN